LFAAGAIGTAQGVNQFMRIITEAYQNCNHQLHQISKSALSGTNKGSQEFMGLDMGKGIFVGTTKKNKYAVHQGANEGFRCLVVYCFDGDNLGDGFTILCNSEQQGLEFIVFVSRLLIQHLQLSDF
jgi:hypothetical protein